MAIILALIPALCWGSIGLISGKLGGTSYQQTLGMTVGALLFGIFSIFYFQPQMSGKVWIIGILSGLFWSVGQFQQFQSMKAIGISVTVPVSTGAQLVFTTLAGVVIFHEWTTSRMLILGTTAMIVLIAGIVFTSLRDRASVSKTKFDAGAGARAIIFSTIGYTLYTVIVRWSAVDTKAVLFPQAIGMVLGAIAFTLAARRNALGTPMVKNVATGLVWGIGNFFMFMAIPAVGLAISYSLAQSGIIISTFGSILLLGEKKTHREMVYITIGSLLVIGGSIILALLK